MLCPEVYNFKAPSSIFKSEKGVLNQTGTFDKINNFYYNHLVSVVLPDTLKVPEYLTESLINDCDYYKVIDLSIARLFDKDFVDNFIRQGNLIGLSTDTRIDCDNCVAVTSSNKLILSLTKETYQTLGLEGKLSHFGKKTKNRYIVSIDLLSEQFIPGKKSYERTKQCLEKLSNLTMIFIWEPPKNNICPSSLAKYFHDLDYDVKLCKPSFSMKMELGMRVPVIDDDLVDMYDIVEWIGMFSIGADLKNGSHDSFLNTYFIPEPNKYCKNVKYMEWRGFFTSGRIQKFIQSLGSYLQKENKPWASIYVQGFSDSATNWKENEHHFYTNGDNGYLILLKSDQTYTMATNATSMKYYK